MSKIYITGASGRLGREVLKIIPGAIPLVRKRTRLKNEIKTDFSLSQLKEILKDASVIIHLAGSRDYLDKKKTYRGNVALTHNIVNAAPESAKIIFSSSISVYGKKLAELPADEDTELRPDTPYAKTKLNAESIVASRPKHVILRIGPIYGPEFQEYFKVLKRIDRGKMAIIGGGRNHIPFVHVSDVVVTIKNAITMGQGTYVLVGESLTQEEIFAIAAKELNVAAPSKHMPKAFAELLAHLELMRTTYLGGKALFIPEDIAVLSSDRDFNCAKAKKELGFSPKTMKQGIREMVAIYRRN